MYEKCTIEILISILICILLQFCAKTPQTKSQNTSHKGKENVAYKNQPTKKKKSQNGSESGARTKLKKSVSQKAKKNEGQTSSKNKTAKKSVKVINVEKKITKQGPQKEASQREKKQKEAPVLQPPIEENAPKTEPESEPIANAEYYKGPLKNMDATRYDSNPALHRYSVKCVAEGLTLDPKHTKYAGNIDTDIESKQAAEELKENFAKMEEIEKQRKKIEKQKEEIENKKKENKKQEEGTENKENKKQEEETQNKEPLENHPEQPSNEEEQPERVTIINKCKLFETSEILLDDDDGNGTGYNNGDAKQF